MIYLSINNLQLQNELEKKFQTYHIKYKVFDPTDKIKLLNDVYKYMPSVLIIDNYIKSEYAIAFKELITKLNQNIFIFIIKSTSSSEDNISLTACNETNFYAETITFINSSSAEEIFNILNEYRIFNKYFKHHSPYKKLLFYNPYVAAKILAQNNGIGIITIDISNFKEIEIEYGFNVVSKIKEVFENILINMKGTKGCFRSSDILFKKSPISNLYYLFLNKSRNTGLLPLPGMLEKITDRLSIYIHNALYKELMLPANERKIPKCVKYLPDIILGYNSIVYNPCLNAQDIVENAINKSLQNAQIQLQRFKNKQKELIQTIIQGKNFLTPNFQCIFNLQKLTYNMVCEVQQTSSIKPIKDLIFSFESLMRVNLVNLKNVLKNDYNVIDLKFLTPDNLFRLSHKNNLALELDQACLANAITHAQKLNSFIMLNILPRNLYLIDVLSEILNLHSNIIFEVSESEAINNFDLILQAKEKLSKMNIHIAVDDFGKGLSGLDRIINLEPKFIKFDRSIITNVDKDPIKQSYVNGVVNAAKMLNTQIVAEGVERWEEAQFLQQLGIDFVQGFLLHKPQKIEDIIKDLEEDYNNQTVAA